MRLALGSAQFGLDYGISNKHGQTALAEVARIIEIASDAGIDTIDTASLYGQSEEILGKLLPPAHTFRIVTKSPHFRTPTITRVEVDQLMECFEQSLNRLNVSSVYGLLVHNAEDLLAPGGQQLYDALQWLKDDGRVTKVGVSLYEPSQVDQVLSRFDVDLVQVPINVLDQRLVTGGQLDRLKARGVEVHARSAYLQGLILMPEAQVPQYFAPITHVLSEFAMAMKKMGCSLEVGALSFLKQLPQIDRIVVGNTSTHELQANLGSFNYDLPDDFNYSGFAVDDPMFVNPSKWRIG